MFRLYHLDLDKDNRGLIPGAIPWEERCDDAHQGITRSLKRSTRRQWLTQASLLTVGGAISLTTPAYAQPPNLARFVIRDIFGWATRHTARRLAFKVIRRESGEYVLQSVDLQCSSCGFNFRNFISLALTVAAAASFSCPMCSAGMRLTIIGARVLVARLMEYGIDHALGFCDGHSSTLHRIGSCSTAGGRLEVVRSTLSRDVRKLSPIGRIRSGADLNYRRVHYFTYLSAKPNGASSIRQIWRGYVGGESSFGTVEHVWFKNGLEEWSKKLDVEPPTWRTHTNKRVSPGTWIAATRSDGGAYLDIQQFQI